MHEVTVFVAIKALQLFFSSQFFDESALFISLLKRESCRPDFIIFHLTIQLSILVFFWPISQANIVTIKQ
jgi:hypothetical protein